MSKKRVHVPFMCLNMIVKNEAHVIKETLESISKYIDYYVISDTGSTDNTKEIIKTFFDSKKIKGEIHDNSWVDFGYNRSLALKLCETKSKYIWIIDADDLIVGNLVLPDLKLDSYGLTYGTGFTYIRHQIVRNSPALGWHYVGVLHEVIASKFGLHSSGTIKGK